MTSFSGDFSRWERRLAREVPFFLRVFQERGVKRVLDVACGRGRHAVSLAEEGYQVTGLDIDGDRLDLARAHAQEQGVRVPFVEGSFLELSRLTSGPFDALYCVGNALSFCRSAGEVAEVLGEFRSVLRPGGVAVAQILNYVGIAHREERLDFVRSYVRDGVEQVVVKFFRFGEPFWDAEFVMLRREGDRWEAELASASLLALEADLYRRLWLEAGFESVELFGDYSGTPFDVGRARDAIAVALSPG